MSSTPTTDQPTQLNLNHNRPQFNNTLQILGFTLDPTDLLLYFLLFFISPLPIVVRKGASSKEFLIGLILFLFFSLPGTLYAFYIIYDTSLITGSNQGIESRVQWSLNRSSDYQNLDVENQNQETSPGISSEDAPLLEHGVYHDEVPEEEPPTYHESSAAGSSEDAENANRDDTKVFNDNKVQN